MKDSTAVIVAMLVASAIVWPNAIARAANNTAKLVNELFLDKNMKEISKRDAVKILLNDGNTIVLRCSSVELSDKLAIRKRK